MSEEELKDYMQQVSANEDSAIKLIEINKKLVIENERLRNELETQNLDMGLEIEHLKEKIKDIEQDRDENFKRIPIAEQVGISDKDFY